MAATLENTNLCRYFFLGREDTTKCYSYKSQASYIRAHNYCQFYQVPPQAYIHEPYYVTATHINAFIHARGLRIVLPWSVRCG